MKYQANLRYGKKDEPWRVNIFTAIGALLLFPVSMIVGFIIMGLIVIYNFLLMDSHHIEFKVTPRKVQMPDGSIRDPETHEL